MNISFNHLSKRVIVLLVFGLMAITGCIPKLSGETSNPEPLPEELVVLEDNVVEADAPKPYDLTPDVVPTYFGQARREWARLRRKRELIESGYCDDQTNLGEGDHDYYCLDKFPRTAASLGGIAVDFREASPFLAQIVYSNLAAREQRFATRFPDKKAWQYHHICGGSLIARDWVLTAAHCFQVDRPDYFGVRLDVGDISKDGASTIAVTDIITHPDYDKATNFNDIALLKLDMQGAELDLQPLYETAFEEVSWGMTHGPIADVTLIDEQMLVLNMRGRGGQENWAELVDITVGRRVPFPGMNDLEKVTDYVAEPGSLTIWRGRNIHLYAGSWSRPERTVFSDDIRDVDYDPKTRQLAVLGRSGTLTLFDRRLRPQKTSTVSPDYEHVDIIGRSKVKLSTSDGRWANWEVGQTQADFQFEAPLFSAIGHLYHDFPGQPKFLSDSRFDGDQLNRFFFPGDDHVLEFSDGVITLSEDNRERTFQTDLFPAKLALHPEGRYIAVVGPKPDPTNWIRTPDGSIHGEIIDVRNGARTTFETEPGFLGSSVQFIGEGEAFALWTSHGKTQIRDTKTGELVADLPHSFPINRVRINDGNLSLSRSNFGTIEVVNLAEPSVLARIYHGKRVHGMQALNGKLMSWSHDGRIRLWDLNNERRSRRSSIADADLVFEYRVREEGDVSSIPGGGLVSIPTVSLIGLSNVVPQDQTEFSQTVRLFGWGKTQKASNAPPSARLRMVGMTPISWDQCIASYPPTAAQQREISQTGLAPAPRDELRDPKAFCAQAPGRKSCAGDSGGPVVHQGSLVGIVSRGSGMCKDDDRTSTYTSVASFQDWIVGHVCPTQRPGQQDNGTNSYPTFCSAG